MELHSTNYFDTFIEVATDTKATAGTVPPSRNKKSVAELQYELVAGSPYCYTSDDVFFQVFAVRNDLTSSEYEQARQLFFSKGQPCFRASPLTKTYGFGVHSDSFGRVALVGMETVAYQEFLDDPAIKKVKAMKSGR
jgi:hypothetical protein